MEEFYQEVWKKYRKSADENVLQCQLVRNCVSKAKCLINLIAKSNTKRNFLGIVIVEESVPNNSSEEFNQKYRRNNENPLRGVTENFQPLHSIKRTKGRHYLLHFLT